MRDHDHRGCFLHSRINFLHVSALVLTLYTMHERVGAVTTLHSSVQFSDPLLGSFFSLPFTSFTGTSDA